MNLFKHRHFKYDIIIWAVRWYCKYGISYCDLEEMRMFKKGKFDFWKYGQGIFGEISIITDNLLA